MSFPDEEMPGIDLVLPDFTYLRQHSDELKGIVLTLDGLYALVIYNHGLPTPSGTGVEGKGGFFSGGIKVRGKAGNRALIIGFTAAVMTLSKTMLYCEYIECAA